MLGLFTTNYYGTGWMPSALSYDFCSGTEWGVRNIHFNQLYQHRQTMSHIHDVPMFNYNCGSLYFGPTFSPLEQIIKQTLGYADWQNRMQGGVGLIDKNGQFNPMGLFSNGWNNPTNNGFNISTPGFNYNPINPWNNGYQTNPFNNNGNNNGNSDLTEAEIKNKKVFEKLTNLLTEISNFDALTDDQKAAIEHAQNEVNKKEKYEDKVKVLEAAFKKIGPEAIKEALISSKNDTYRSALMATGWEDDTKLDDKLVDLLTDIDKVSKKDSNITSNTVYSMLITPDTILDVLSSWNSKYANATPATKQRVLTHMLARYYQTGDKKLEDGMKEDFAETIFAVVKALKDNANSFIRANEDVLTKGQKEAIKENVKKLEQIQEDGLPETDNGKLAKVFDELYMQLRIAKVQVINKEVVEKYGIADPEKKVFNDELFVKETKADLVSEGFIADPIEDFVLVKDPDKLTQEEKVQKNKEKAVEIANNLKEQLPTGNSRVNEEKREKIKALLSEINKDNVVEILKEFPELADRITYVNDWGNGFGVEEVKTYIIQPLLDKYGELEASNGKKISSLEDIKEYKIVGLKTIIQKVLDKSKGLDVVS